jgi:purine-cytosine permease-like protein
MAGGHTDAATTVVTEFDRMGRGSLTMVWWSLCSAMFYLVLGGALALQFGTRNALIGAVLGVMSQSSLAYMFARYAIRTGQSSFLLSESLFGSSGAALTSLIFFLTTTYYAVFESSIVALAAASVIPSVSRTAICLVIVSYSVLLVAGPVQRFLDKFNGALLPVYLIGLAVTVVLAIGKYGYSDAWLHIGPPGGPSSTGWWSCFMAFFGQQLLMMCTLDFARFGRREDTSYHSLVAFGAPFYAVAFLMNSLVGIFLAGVARYSTVSETVVMDTCLAVLGGGAGLAFIWVTQTRINTANYFLAATNLQAVLGRTLRGSLPRLACAALVGVIVAGVLLFTDVIRYLLVALNYQGVILTAWVGVALAHIVADNRAMAAGAATGTAAKQVPLFNSRGLVAWACSAIVGLVMLQVGGNSATLSVPASLAVAWFAYRALHVKALALAAATG